MRLTDGLVVAAIFAIVRSAWYEDIYSFTNESRFVSGGEWTYCSGTPTIPNESLYVVQECLDSTVQTPLLNASEVAHEFYAVSNLSFCCKVNYTSVLPAGTNLTEKDREAEFFYNLAVEGFFASYDCTTLYPYSTCGPCLYTYRSWVCSLMFPLACSSTSDAGAAQALQVCAGVCLEVIRKCPPELNFRCPMDSIYATYGNPQPTGVLGGAASFGNGGCNPMQYNTELWNSASGSTMYLALLLVAVAQVWIHC
jgi:hypothetical protein